MRTFIDYLSAKLKCLIWRLSPKHTMEVAGHNIRYVIPFWWLIIAWPYGKTFFSDGQFLIRRKKNEIMIFIPHRQIKGVGHKSLRYLLYHEHLESLFFLNFPFQPYGEKWADDLFEESLQLFEKDCSSIRRIIDEMIDNQEKILAHYFALLAELLLVYKEQGEEEYRKALDYAIDYRL